MNDKESDSVSLPKEEIVDSLKVFKQRRDYLLHEDVAAFDHYCERFVEFCDSNPLVQRILAPLEKKFETDVDAWWVGATDRRTKMLPWCITLDNSKGISRLRFWCKNSRVNGINDLPVFMHQGSRELGNASADAFDGVRARATDVRGRQVAFGNQIETESPPAAAPLDAVGFVIGRGSLELGFQRKFPVSLESSEAFLGIAPGGLVGRLSRALQSVFGKPTARRVVSTRTSRRVRYRGAGLTSPRREGR